MQTQVETLNYYNNAFDALCEAQELVEQLEMEISSILDSNTEPIIIPVSGGGEREIITPDDLRLLDKGTVITMGDIEYVRTGYAHGPWVSFLGTKYSCDKMFRAMLEHEGECEIVHEGN